MGLPARWHPIDSVSTAHISRMLALRDHIPHRYIVITTEDTGPQRGDAVGKLSELLSRCRRISRSFGRALHRCAHAAAATSNLSSASTGPVIAFSEVSAFELNHEAIQFIHQPGGSDDAQVLVHFHDGQPDLCGEDFPGDGYAAD